MALKNGRPGGDAPPEVPSTSHGVGTIIKPESKVELDRAAACQAPPGGPPPKRERRPGDHEAADISKADTPEDTAETDDAQAAGNGGHG